MAVKALNPRCEIIGIEPKRCASWTAALAAGKPVPVSAARATLADGLAVTTVGGNSFCLAKDLIDEVTGCVLSLLRLFSPFYGASLSLYHASPSLSLGCLPMIYFVLFCSSPLYSVFVFCFCHCLCATATTTVPVTSSTCLVPLLPCLPLHLTITLPPLPPFLSLSLSLSISFSLSLTHTHTHTHTHTTHTHAHICALQHNHNHNYITLYPRC